MGKAKKKIRKKRCGRSKRKERANAFERAAEVSMACYDKFYEKVREQERENKESIKKYRNFVKMSWLKV